MLTQVRIEVTEHLAGCKKAVRLGEVVYVSPAMYSLMKDSTPEELAHLLKHLRVVNMGEFDPLKMEPLPWS